MRYLETILHDIIPPMFLKIFKRESSRYGFFGNYTNWKDAQKASTGYDSDIILNKVKDALLKVKSGEAAYERDSVLFDKIQYSWPLLAGLLWIASHNENKLNLVDYGGSLGSSYYQNRKFLTHLKELRWNIIEQRKYVDCGKQYFINEHLKYYYDLNTCINEQNPDSIIFSGVIQYIKEPYSLLKEVKAIGFKYMIFDRTPFLLQSNDRLTIQKVPPNIFEASYPAWLLNLAKFLNFVSDKYEVVADFDGFEKVNIKAVCFKGFILKKRA